MQRVRHGRCIWKLGCLETEFEALGAPSDVSSSVHDFRTADTGDLTDGTGDLVAGNGP